MVHVLVLNMSPNTLPNSYLPMSAYHCICWRVHCAHVCTREHRLVALRAWRPLAAEAAKQRSLLRHAIGILHASGLARAFHGWAAAAETRRRNRSILTQVGFQRSSLVHS